jgi:NDP-sugar pyrophosphorylase family protein
VEVGAILIVEGEGGAADSSVFSKAATHSSPESFLPDAVALVEVLGASLLEHMIGRFIAAGVKTFAVVVHKGVPLSSARLRRSVPHVHLYEADETWSAVIPVLKAFAKDGIDGAFVMKPHTYCEPDFTDLWDFHSDGHRPVTRACDPAGPVDLWVTNCDFAGQGSAEFLKAALLEPDSLVGSYFVRDYVKRIKHPADFRQLVKDCFQSRCNLHPIGEQLRTGIWMDEGAQIRKGARIVGPAYLGRGSVVGECALVTRSSNVESSSYVDYGTAIEDSTVFPNTYVGMWLDVRRSLVSTNKLFHLHRGVTLEIGDASLLCSNVPTGKKTVRLPETRSPQALVEVVSEGSAVRSQQLKQSAERNSDSQD